MTEDAKTRRPSTIPPAAPLDTSLAYGKTVARSLIIVRLLAERGPLTAAAIHRAVLESLTEGAHDLDDAAGLEAAKVATGWTDRTFQSALELASRSEAVWFHGRHADGVWRASSAVVMQACPCRGGRNN